MSGHPKDEAQAQRVAGLIRRMEEAGAAIEERMPKPLMEMSFEERTAWLEQEGVRDLTPEEISEYYGGEGVANITFLGASRSTTRMGLTPPDPAAVERLAAGMEDEMVRIEASLPKPWAEMARDERVAWLREQGVSEQTPAEARARYGDATIIFFGSSQSAMRRGSIVRVQEANGAWRNQMVAVAAADGLIHVTEETEWQAAQAEGREPQTTAYPEERVALAEGE
jgi:hypothetical protein